MASMIFINVATRDLAASRAFFEKLGFSINPQFSDDTAACVVVSETIYFMVLTHSKMAQFTSLPISDATRSTEALYALSRGSKAEVDSMVDAALKAGGTEPRAVQDMGFMYSRAFTDLDGHIFEILWMDPGFVQPS